MRVRTHIDRKLDVYFDQLTDIFGADIVYNADLIVSYPLFCKDEEYRRGICTLLGGKYNEDKLNHISSEGKGSSFDGLDYQGKASEMSTDRRSDMILASEHSEIYLKLLGENEYLGWGWSKLEPKLK